MKKMYNKKRDKFCLSSFLNNCKYTFVPSNYSAIS